MRLIDAGALKELICSNVYPVADDFNSRDYGMFWTGGIEKAIDEMPTISEAEPHWIPVSERLPEKHGDYLVTATGENLGKKYIRVEVGQWLGDAFWIGWYEPDKKILAWMPLPQPWKGENDE